MTVHFVTRRDERPHVEERLRREPRPVREAVAVPAHDARVLTGGGVEARILLDGTPYVLRITRLGKLILTK
ncbi:MAG: hemin uptake protein HemP [Amaricoccus sp.]|nr:hemin uptake protein HemP [Amaricoccus sp.]